MFPASNNSLCVSGMAGGRVYEILVEVYGNKPDCTPQKSNKLVSMSGSTQELNSSNLRKKKINVINGSLCDYVYSD